MSAAIAFVNYGLSRPGSKSRGLQDIVLAELRAREERDRQREETGEPERELPTSIRFLYYVLEQMGVLSKQTAVRTDGKKGRRSDQDLQDAVTHLREHGIVPWDWIVDESRSYASNSLYDSLGERVTAALEYGHINPWRGTERPILTDRGALGVRGAPGPLPGVRCRPGGDRRLLSRLSQGRRGTGAHGRRDPRLLPRGRRRRREPDRSAYPPGPGGRDLADVRRRHHVAADRDH